jgi:hypothetical protein
MRLMLKILLGVGGVVCALASMWSLVCIFGTWFIGPPRDPSITIARDVLTRAGMSALLLGASIGFGLLSEAAFRRALATASS